MASISASASRSRRAAGSSAVGSEALMSMIASTSLPRQLADGAVRRQRAWLRASAARSSCIADRADDLLEADARHQLHAQQPLIGRFVDLFGKHLHDVGVLEPGHRAAFAAAIGRDLERHLPIERQLAGRDRRGRTRRGRASARSRNRRSSRRAGGPAAADRAAPAAGARNRAAAAVRGGAKTGRRAGRVLGELDVGHAGSAASGVYCSVIVGRLQLGCRVSESCRRPCVN